MYPREFEFDGSGILFPRPLRSEEVPSFFGMMYSHIDELTEIQVSDTRVNRYGWQIETKRPEGETAVPCRVVDGSVSATIHRGASVSLKLSLRPRLLDKEDRMVYERIDFTLSAEGNRTEFYGPDLSTKFENFLRSYFGKVQQEE